MPNDERDCRRDAEAGEQADEAGARVRPEQKFAGTLVGDEGQTVDRIGQPASARQKLVIGIFRQSRGRAEGIGNDEQHEGRQHQGELRPGSASC